MPEPSARLTPQRLKFAGFIALMIAVLVVAVGVFARVHADQGLKTWTKDQEIPTVSLARLEGAGERDLVLPGAIQALNTAPIHARVSGYLKRWYVDIGANVSAGQVLAEVDTPDLDQQVLQARANLAVAQASQKLAATTAERWKDLLAQNAVSRQEADEKTGDLAARNAAVGAARADLDRLLALGGFKRITAPFAGVVTARNTDIGALIAAGAPTDTPLFTIADERRLRIYVQTPQAYSAMVTRGMNADLTVPEHPGETFKAQVVSDARAVNPQSGAVLTELQLDNHDGRLRPGAYVQVAFKLPSPATAVSLPASAIQFRNAGPVVAVVGPDEHVHIRPIKIGRDLGARIEIAEGVQPGARIVDNPPEFLTDGDRVRIASRPPPTASKSG
jgi:RND family efflux transporter MFP subunit